MIKPKHTRVAEANLPNGVSYVSAACGAGKSYWLAVHIAEQLGLSTLEEPKRFLYVAPTIALIGEFEGVLQGHGIANCQTFHSENSHVSVTKRLMELLKDSNKTANGAVVLITHASFLNLPYFHNRADWQIFIDEVPQIDKYYRLNIPKNASHFRTHLQTLPYTEQLALICKKSGANLDEFLAEKDDGFSDDFRDLLYKIESPNYTVYARPSIADAIISRDESSNDQNFKALILINANTFNGCCILGSNLEHSMLFDHLKRHNRTPQPFLPIVNRIRDRGYPESLGKRTTIYYCLKKNRYSKSIRLKTTVDGQTVKEAIDAAIMNNIGSEKEYLNFSNKDDQGPIALSRNAEQLSGNPSGLNQYSHYACIVFIAALNRTADHLSIFNYLGLTNDVIAQSTIVERIHQSVMRTNLRLKGVTDPVEIYLADKWTADRLGKILGCSNIVQLGNIELPSRGINKVTAYSQVDKNKRAKVRKFVSSLHFHSQNMLPIPLNNREKGNTFQDFEDELHGLKFHVTFHKDLYAKASSDFVEEVFTPKQLITQFRRFAEAPIDRKVEGLLFNFSTFKVIDDQQGYRTKANFHKAYGTVLDFDNGDLSPEEFERIFWFDAGPSSKRFYLIMNSFSRSKIEKHRFRVIMPYKVPVASMDGFEAIYDSLAMRLAEVGYDADNSGLDKRCRTGVQSFYMPCTNRRERDSAFFRKPDIPNKEIERYLIDPKGYIKTMSMPSASKSISTFTLRKKDNSSAFLQWVESQYWAIKALHEGRHDPIWAFGIELLRHGWSRNEIEQKLFSLAGNDKNMKRHAKGFMTWLNSQNKKKI